MIRMQAQGVQSCGTSATAVALVPGAARLAGCHNLRRRTTPLPSRATRARTVRPSSIIVAAASTKKTTLYTKLGGAPAVTTAVDLLYNKMMADSRVSPFFEGIDMKQQRAHQAAFLSFALGGTKAYDGNSNMTSAHARLVPKGLRIEHFDIVLEHLGSALTDLSVPQEEIAEAAATVETLRPAFQAAIDGAEE